MFSTARRIYFRSEAGCEVKTATRRLERVLSQLSYRKKKDSVVTERDCDKIERYNVIDYTTDRDIYR